MRLQMTRAVLAVLTAALAAACAGGGGGGGGGIAISPPLAPPPLPPSPPPPPPPPPPGGTPSATSAEYTRGYAVADTKAIVAWQNGATGQGVLVAVIDDGVDASHPELAGRISPASRDINAARNTVFDIGNTHGSELSAIIAGNFNNAQTIGLAYNATVLGVRADNGAGGFNAADLAAAIDYAIAQGAKVINFSLGSANPSSATFQNAIQRATGAGLIVVVAAGNDGPFAGEVNYPGFLATSPAISNNLILVAGAHDRNGSQVSFSNRAGQAQNFYLTAPGLEIIVPDFANPGPTDPAFQVCFADLTCQVQGTSYSAPYLTGAVALVVGAFPALTPQQVVQLLLTSADDYGAPGVDAVVGHGRLNIGRAFQPMGALSAPLAKGVDVRATDPLGVGGEAFGDGLTEDPGLWLTVGFDSYGRTFAVDLARNWRAAVRAAPAFDAPMVWRNAPMAGGSASFAGEDRAPPQTLRTSFDAADASTLALRGETALGIDTRIAFAVNTSALRGFAGFETGGHLAFAGVETSVAAIHQLGPRTQLALTAQGGGFGLGGDMGASRRQAMAAELSHAAGPVGAALTLGALQEDGSLLGLAWTQRLGARPDSEAAFFGVEGYWRPSPWLTFHARGEAGRSARTDGWLGVVAPLRTSTFALGASVDATPAFVATLAPEPHGRIALTLRQPLRIEGGALAVSLPTADAWGRSSLAYETRRFDPAPQGRELELEAAWDLFVAGRLSARAAIAHTREPGHVEDAEGQSRAQVGVRLNY